MHPAMPELAEVEFFRKRWHQAAQGKQIVQVLTHDRKKLFRSAPASELKNGLKGTTLRSSMTAAKQMLFRFGSDKWLGIHLGMTGELRVETATYSPLKHDHSF